MSESESKRERERVRAREHAHTHLTFIFVRGYSHDNGYHPPGLIFDHLRLYKYDQRKDGSGEEAIGPVR